MTLYKRVIETFDHAERNREDLNMMRQVERETVEDMLDFAKNFDEYFSLDVFLRKYAEDRKIRLEK